MADKKAGLAGPDISPYEGVDKVLPHNFKALLGPKDRMKPVYKINNFIEENLCKELNLFMVQQSKEAQQEHFIQLPYHQAILNDEIPLSIGGGIGQSRTFMYLLRTAHIGEVSTTVWLDTLKAICKRKNIHVLE